MRQIQPGVIFYLPEENTLEKQVQVVQEQRLVIRSSIVKNKVSCRLEVIVVIVVSFLL